MDTLTPASFLVESGRAVTEIASLYPFAHKEAPMQYQAKSPSAPRPSNSGFTLMSLSRNSGVAGIVDVLWIFKTIQIINVCQFIDNSVHGFKL